MCIRDRRYRREQHLKAVPQKSAEGKAGKADSSAAGSAFSAGNRRFVQRPQKPGGRHAGQVSGRQKIREQCLSLIHILQVHPGDIEGTDYLSHSGG